MKTWSIGYEKSKIKAKKLYSKIGRIQCPAFGGEHVSFTSEGFNHLIRKGRLLRTKNEQKRRFVLIPHIEKIIKNPKAIIFYEKRETRVVSNRHGEKIIIQSIADFWTFIEVVNNCRIKVVIRQISEKGSKHFFSVMGDKVHINRGRKRKTKEEKNRIKKSRD